MCECVYKGNKDDDDGAEGSSSMENCTITSNSLTSVECQLINSSYTTCTLTNCEQTSHDTVNTSESTDSLVTTETDAESNSQSAEVDQLESTLHTVEQPMLQPIPVMYSAAQISSNPPSQPMVLLQQPPSASPVVCIEFTCCLIEVHYNSKDTKSDIRNIKSRITPRLN